MSKTQTNPGGWGVRWPLYAGMSVAGAAAVVASASTLAALARAAGWSSWTPWLLPAAVDIGGSAGGWCWLRPGIPQRARHFGATVAIAGALASLIGNAAGHLLAAGYIVAGPVLVVVVGAVPAIVLVALAHLAALLGAPAPMVDAGQLTSPDTSSTPADAAGAETGALTGPPEDTRLTVLQLIGEHPRTVGELAQATGKARSTVNGHLKALVRNGAVSRSTDKRYRTLHRPQVLPSSTDPAEGNEAEHGD